MKEKLVLIPGTLCDERLWMHQIEHLQDLVDPIVAEIKTENSIEKVASSILQQVEGEFSVAGLSMGGMVALEMMKQGGERVRKLALLDTNPYPPTPEQKESFQRNIDMCQAGDFEMVFSTFIFPNLLTKKGKENAELASIVESMASTIGPNSYINQLTALKNREGYVDILRNIQCLTLVLTGEQDVLCPVKLHQEMAEHIQDSKLVVVEDCGHLSSLEKKEDVTQAMREWLLT